MKKNIKDIFKKWGDESKVLPTRNSILKEEVLSKVPFNVNEYRKIEKKSVLPYFSLAFVGVAMLFIVVNLIPKENNNFAINNGVTNTKQIAKVIDNDKKESNIVSSVRNRIKEDNGKIANVVEQNKNVTTTNSSYPNNMPTSGITTASPSLSASAPTSQYDSSASKNTQSSMIFPDLGNMQVPINDVREFLKINYSATLKTRNTGDTVRKAEDIVRSSGGRVDGTSDSEGSSYVRFSVKAQDFENFRTEIKGLVNVHLFSEEKSVTNMLSQKQNIEKNQNSAQIKINEIKDRKSKIVKNHNTVLASFDDQLAGLEMEVFKLKTEYKTANPFRKNAILTRLSQITNQENVILQDYDAEIANFNAKVSVVNNELENAGATLDEINAQDLSFMQDIATVSGTLYIEHVNIYEFVDAYVPGPLIAYVLILIAGLLYLRYRMFQMNVEI